LKSRPTWITELKYQQPIITGNTFYVYVVGLPPYGHDSMNFRNFGKICLQLNEQSTYQTRSGHLWRWVDTDYTRIHH